MGSPMLSEAVGCRKVSDAKVFRNLQSLLQKNGKRQRHTLAAPRTHSQELRQEGLVNLGILPRSRRRSAASRALRGPRKEAVLLLDDLVEPAAVVLVIQLPADVDDGPARRMPANNTQFCVPRHGRAAPASASDAPGRRARPDEDAKTALAVTAAARAAALTLSACSAANAWLWSAKIASAAAAAASIALESVMVV